MDRAGIKRVNLALQGGGAHGAFAWGILDKFAEDGRLDLEGLSATSAGSMNAVVYAQGRMNGGLDGAREALEKFWRDISEAGQNFSPVRASGWEAALGLGLEQSPSYILFETLTRTFSPYQFNPFNFNPLRDVLAKNVDIDAIHACSCVELFICATNVRTGQPRIFRNREVTLDAVLASACLPFLFQAVEIDGEHYWDGGYMGNPALYPFFNHTQSRDIVIAHINPILRPQLPTTASEIQNRLNEITFNSSLLRELRAIAFVTKLIEQDWLKDEYRNRLKHVLIHSIRADEALCDLTVASKFRTDWAFLCGLRDLGRAAAARWLERSFDHLGHHSTVDLRSEYLGETATGKEHVHA
ncbi:MAG TPA: patatin-like phospholipase family protein [Burkholderiales bacterium]|nr:patatin-like phospholipase family protein [Burkholderiales bacterium]